MEIPTSHAVQFFSFGKNVTCGMTNDLPRAFSVRNNSQRGAKRRVSHNKSPSLFSQNQIPKIQSDPVQTLTVRYIVDESAADVIAFTIELPQYPYANSYASGYALLPFKAVRISKVDLWCNYRPSVSVAGNTISLSCVERRTVRPIEWTDTATFLTPARITKHFNTEEPLGLWYSTTSGETNPELRFQLTKGSTLDITYNYVVHDGEQVGVAASGSFTTFPRIYTNQLYSGLVPVGKSFAAVIAA